MSAARSITLDDIDRRIVAATSVGLPLVAELTGVSANELYRSLSSGDRKS